MGRSFDHCLCYVYMCVVIRGGAPRIMDVGCVLSDSLGGAPVMVWACTPVRPVGGRGGADGGVYVGVGVGLCMAEWLYVIVFWTSVCVHVCVCVFVFVFVCYYLCTNLATVISCSLY